MSIKQPWAWLVCIGHKDIENRNWQIGRNPQHGPYKSQTARFSIELPARIYVHAGKQADRFAPDISGEIWSEYDIYCGAHQAFGAIIGEVDITACVTESKSPWFAGKYGFVLANPVLYHVAIPCKGSLGFFEPGIDFFSKDWMISKPLDIKKG